MKVNPFQDIYDLCNKGNSQEKMENLPEFPRLIDIEATNSCNFRCLMCPTGNLSMKRKTGMMASDVYYKILEEVAEWGCALRWVQWGENVLHPDLLEHISAAHRKGVLTHLNTNGSKMNAESIEALIETGLDSIKFSFQGVDRKSYAEMRNTDFYDELMDVIELFHKIRGDRNRPYIHISTSITYESDEQVKSFKARAEPIADYVSVGRTVFDNLDLDSVRLKQKDIDMLYHLMSQQSVVKVHPECPEVFDKMSIFWDGTVSACCGDADKKMLIGNVVDKTLQEIWNSTKMNEYRDMLVQMRHDELDLCKNCYDYQGLQNPEENAL